MRTAIVVFVLLLIAGALWLFSRPDVRTEPTDTSMGGEGAVQETGPQKLQLDPAKYSFDLSGAERIIVQYDDSSSGKPLPFEQKTITDEAQIHEVVELLSGLPAEGDLELETSPGLVTTIAGYRGNELVGYVQFHRTLLRAENGNFYADVPNEVGQRESRLYSIVAELR